MKFNGYNEKMYNKLKKNFLKKNNVKYTEYINWRFLTLCMFIFLSFFVLTTRIIFLQLINNENLIYASDRRTLRIEPLMNTRGIITDRIGHPLAVTVPVRAVYVDPRMIINKKDIIKHPRWIALSTILSTPLTKIIAHINAAKNSKFTYLARQITIETGDYIKQLKLPGIFLLKESKRYYPSGKISAQLIGMTNIDGDGIEGVEKSFNVSLKGKSGTRKIRKDKNGHVVENIHLVEKFASTNLTLSIDEKLQNIVYDELAKSVSKNHADSGTAVLIHINTGEILAMANAPSYNPNNKKHIIKENIRNRAITDMFEPGSTIKPIVIMEGLKLNVININSNIQTEPYFIGKHIIQDISYHKNLSISGILKTSSNVGVSKIASLIPISKLINSYMQFGLGKPTSLGLIGEKSGLFPKKKTWSNLERVNFSFGYGLMTTPLQLARMYATIGSYGIYRPLSITKVNHEINGKKIFPKQYVKNVIHMMEDVAKTGGSGEKAQVKGYRVAVKTGTTKKVGNHGVYVKKYISYIAGIAPASHPEFSLVIMIDNPKMGKYYGGTISAPVFSKIMKSILKEMHIKPDDLSIQEKINEKK